MTIRRFQTKRNDRGGGMAVLVVLLPALYFIYASWLLPVSAYYANYDPEFPYLLNSLEVFKGQPYYYVDHPGGPLEMIGTAIYALTFPILRMNTNGFIDFHLSHPRVFLTAAHAVILLWTLATMVYLSRYPVSGRQSTAAAVGAAAALSYFAVHPQAFGALLLWSHNSFAFAFGTLLLALLFRLLQSASPDRGLGRLPLAALSLGAGLLASITIYLATWVVAYVTVVIIWHALRRSSRSQAFSAVLLVILGSAAGFFVGILPLLPRMPIFLDWIIALVTHANPYLLSGRTDALMVHWSSALLELGHQLPLLFIALLVLGFVAARTALQRKGRWQEDPASWAMTAGVLVAAALLMVLILDHPKTEYMLAVAALVPILMLALARLHAQTLEVKPPLRLAVVCVILAATVVSLSSAVIGHADLARLVEDFEARTRQLQQAYAERLGRDVQSLVVVWTYGAYSPCYSLWFGNDSAGNAFRREIGGMCPRQLALDYFGQTVIPRQGGRTLEETAWDMVVGCSGAFQAPALSRLVVGDTFRDAQLVCGHLTVAYRESQAGTP